MQKESDKLLSLTMDCSSGSVKVNSWSWDCICDIEGSSTPSMVCRKRELELDLTDSDVSDRIITLDSAKTITMDELYEICDKFRLLARAVQSDRANPEVEE